MFPMEDGDPVGIDLGSALSTAATGIESQVGAALPIALTVAGAIVAVTIGWRLFRRFVKG